MPPVGTGTVPALLPSARCEGAGGKKAALNLPCSPRIARSGCAESESRVLTFSPALNFNTAITLSAVCLPGRVR